MKINIKYCEKLDLNYLFIFLDEVVLKEYQNLVGIHNSFHDNYVKFYHRFLTLLSFLLCFLVQFYHKFI